MTHYALRLSASALADLERLQDFLRTVGDPLGADLLGVVIDALNVLTHQPGIGRPVAGGQRELIISQGASGYLARYRLDRLRSVVLVARIRHQRESGYPPEQF